MKDALSGSLFVGGNSSETDPTGSDVRPLVAFEVAISPMAKGFNRLEIVGLRFGIVLQHCRPVGLLKARAFYAWGSLLDRCRSNLLS